MSKKSLAPVGPTLELHPLTVEILAEINPLALLMGIKLVVGTEPGYIGFMKAPMRGFSFAKWKPSALLGGVKIWHAADDIKHTSAIGMQREGEVHWVMTDSIDENEVKSLLTRVASGQPARSTRD